MAKYKVKEEFELPVKQEVGAEVELTEEQAAELGEKVEAVKEGGEGAGEEGK